jgi:hypothetical protein
MFSPWWFSALFRNDGMTLDYGTLTTVLCLLNGGRGYGRVAMQHMLPTLLYAPVLYVH